MGCGSISHRVNIAPKQLQQLARKCKCSYLGLLSVSLKCNVGTLHVLDAESSCNMVVGTRVPGANRIAQNGYGDGTNGPTEHLTARIWTVAGCSRPSGSGRFQRLPATHSPHFTEPAEPSCPLCSQTPSPSTANTSTAGRCSPQTPTCARSRVSLRKITVDTRVRTRSLKSLEIEAERFAPANH